MKTLTFLLLTGLACSRFEAKKETSDQEMMTIYDARWFKTNPQHSLQGQDGNPVHHLFFDVDPEFSREKKTVNAIITTLEKSPHAYQLDLISGQRHYSHSYCEQKDAWKQESGTFGKASFSIGYLPRLLDQRGDPQKIIIFGGREQFARSVDANYFKVKIIGGYIEESCPSGNCLGKNVWYTRLVFIAVDPEDPKFQNIQSLKEWEGKFDWSETRATLENQDGRSQLGEKRFPLVRIKKTFDAPEALNYFRTRSVYFTVDEMKKVQSSCHSLYEKLWTDVGTEREEDRPAKTLEELSVKLKLREDLKKKKVPVGRAARLKKFSEKYFKEIVTCEKFVYHGNVNKDPNRFWFYNYLGIYFRLHKEGYFYDCRAKAWKENIIYIDGNSLHDMSRDPQICSEQDIDRAMGFIPNLLSGIKGSAVWYYKFIDYDQHQFGTHRKLYSWVKVKNRAYECSRDPNEAIVRSTPVFPEEVSWKAWEAQDVQKDLKIIE